MHLLMALQKALGKLVEFLDNGSLTLTAEFHQRDREVDFDLIFELYGHDDHVVTRCSTPMFIDLYYESELEDDLTENETAELLNNLGTGSQTTEDQCDPCQCESPEKKEPSWRYGIF